MTTMKFVNYKNERNVFIWATRFSLFHVQILIWIDSFQKYLNDSNVYFSTLWLCKTVYEKSLENNTHNSFILKIN